MSKAIVGDDNQAITPGKQKPKPNALDIIAHVAQQLRIPVELAWAIAAHESGFNTKAIGDNGTSFGLFQLHQGGELPAPATKEWAFDPMNNAMTALREVAAVFHKHPHLDWGTIAAMAQRPANARAYAQVINDTLKRSGRGNQAANYFNNAYLHNTATRFADYGNVQTYTGARVPLTSTHAPAAATTVKNTIGTTGAGASFGSGGTSGVGGTASDTLAATTTPADFKASLAASGFAQALINSDPSLKKIFQQAITGQWYLSDTGLSRFEAAVRNSKWWTARSKSQRDFDELQFGDHKEFTKQLNDQVVKLQTAATAMGVPLNGGDLATLARLSLRNGLTDQEVNNALAGHFIYKGGQEYAGQSGTTVASIKQLAQQYYAGATDQQIQSWVRQVDAGQLDPASLEDHFKQQALSLFPYLKPQIDAGQTVQSVADQYKSQMASTLEMDPTGIANNDTTVMKGLQMRNQDGTLGLMPLYQYDQMLKQDPRWLQTENAHNTLVGLGSDLLKQWEVIS